MSQLGLVDEGLRRLDADVVKDYLLENLVVTGRVEDLLVRELADAHPVMPGVYASTTQPGRLQMEAPVYHALT